jgi:type II pantothenate kinase
LLLSIFFPFSFFFFLSFNFLSALAIFCCIHSSNMLQQIMDQVGWMIRKGDSQRSLLMLGLTSLSSFLIVGILHWNWLDRGKKVLGFGKCKRKRKAGTINIGAIFGMDVGGTLAKIVYFQPNSSTVPIVKRQSSESLAQLESPDHQAALEQLYTYVDKSSSSAQSAVTRDDALTIYSDYLHGTINFLHFETRNMVTAINNLSAASVTDHIKTVGCTGGGAHKFSNIIQDELDITLNKHDELRCLVQGMMFALLNFPDECFTYRNCDDPVSEPETPSPISTSSDVKDSSVASNSPKPETKTDGSKTPIAVKRWQRDAKEYTRKEMVSLPTVRNTLPYLVVNIGSGVSILKISGPGKYERVSGTSLGGGTYWGLCRLLTKCKTFNEVLDLAENGDAGTVDMMVKDIYGGDYGNMLSGCMVASSFGKLVMKENPLENVRPEDLALGMLMMITNNLGQIAHLCAQLHHCSKIFFVGSFLRHNPISCRRLAFAIDFWSGGTMEALFLRHEGYFGALGTFLYSAFGEDTDRILSETQKQQEKAKKTKSFSLSPDKANGQKTMPLETQQESPVLGEVVSPTAYNGRRPRSSSDDAFLRISTGRKL